MNRKQICLNICLFIVFFSLLSAVAASDSLDNITLSAANDDLNTISVTNNENTLKESIGTFKDLNNLVNDSTSNVVLEGNYSYSVSDNLIDGITIDKSITIDGKGNTLDANKIASIFNIAPNSYVILKNINFINAYGKNGAAINLDSSSTLEIVNCNFINNTATSSGGAIYVNGTSTDPTLKISDSTFEGNNASNGGAIYMAGDFKAVSTIENSTFRNNFAGDGGAAYIDADNVVVRNVIFEGNIVGDDGAAIFWQGNDGIISNITCSDNKGISRGNSSTRGGTICLTGNNVSISKSKFTKSSAYEQQYDDDSKVDGGALFVTGNNVNITDTEFSFCNASNNGGAVYIIGNYTQIINSNFINCGALDGAAIYVEGHDCKLYNSTFTDNVALDDGGAIYWEGDDGVIYNITCINNKGISATKPDGVNTSSTRGGTLSIIGNNITLTKSYFASSRAYIDAGKDSSRVDGGAIFITGNDVHIKESEFYDCMATYSGGAIHVLGNDGQILNCSFNNTKALIGGAVYISGSNALVNNSIFTHNTGSGATKAEGGSGGAIYVDGDGAVISNSDFSFDNAVNYGGAIAVWGANAVITQNTFNDSYVTEYDGGAIFVNGLNTTISFSNFTRDKTVNQFTHGGAIDVSGDDAHILECNFEDCTSYYGGVIQIGGSDAVVEKSTFKDSSATEGGAIYINGVNAVVSQSNFTDISANNYGGAIYVQGTNANISQSNFNVTEVKNYHGGAIYIAGENTHIEKSNFTSSKALNSRNNGNGGAIHIEGAHAVIDESNFNDCKAYETGGAIYSYGNDARIEDSTFNSSSARYGGAIYLTSWGASVTRSNISQCTASLNGGGIYVDDGSIQISESNFDECTAKGTSASNGGGAIYINGPDTHISASNFSHNTVPGSARGGSIFINGERTIIDTSEFVASSAFQGGVIYIQGANAVIDESAFINSSSRWTGGSIYITGDEATVRGSSFDNISAIRDGGAIYIDGEQTDILSSSFYNCTVGMGFRGGAIFMDDMGTTVDHSNFTLSKAGTGGAIYINGVNTTVSYCNLDNNTAYSAGAIKVYGDDTIVSNSNFTYNHALNGAGGAMDIGGSNASVYYSWFDHNSATAEGGAINWLGGHGDDSIIGTTFTNNVAYTTQRGGGAVYWTQGNVIAAGGLIKDSIFINNTAAGRHGGAINWFHALDSKIENCLFENNTANCDGGALYTGDQGGMSVNLTITNSQFYNNTARLYGGAIANQMANSYIFNNTFDGNTAYAGGGTLLMKEGPAKNSVIDSCYIFNSKVGTVSSNYGEGGGAILIADSNITISNSAILNSTIGKGPGGAIAIFSQDCSLINVSIQDVSTQNDDGGAIYWKGTYGKLDNVTIFNASSHSIDGSRSSDGGAIHVLGWCTTLNDIKIFEASANNDENCQRTNYGGSLYIGGSGVVATNIVIDNSTSTNVKMTGGGGAIFWNSANGILINATISNTLASGNGGAIYWKGSSPAIDNVSITYSKTEVTGSSNSADGGAIYSTTVAELNNVYINGASAHKDSGDVRGGAIYLRDAKTLNNVTVVGSRASSDDGTSSGGAVFLERNSGSNTVWIYNSTFDENNADLGAGVYINKVTGMIYGTSFTGNVANVSGGALYAIGSDALIFDSAFAHNSAKNGGAIFTENVHLQIANSTMEFNTAEKKGGAIYHNYNNKAGSSFIKDSEIVNNTAFQGSAIYATRFYKFTLENDVLLDNQANSNKFIEKAVGVDEDGNNYTSAVFVGFDNLLNAIWQENTATALTCTNVTYWGENGKTVMNGIPPQSDREVNINVTVEMYNERGAQITTVPLVTDKNGKVKYIFDAEDGKTYYFAYVHDSDRYYTYLRDTLSNSSLVNIYVYTPIYYAQNQTVSIELTDGAWGRLNGTVTVTFNDTAHTTFTVDVVNGTGFKYNITDLAIGKYNATASYAGDINHTGDTDWVLFEVLPYNDLEITKTVDITADYVNVTDVITYTITVKNHGPSKAYGVNVTERLSPYLKLLRAKPTTGEYNLTGGYWYIGELDADDLETLTIVAEVIHMGPITNTVWVIGLGKDINETNNIDTAHNFTAVPIVDLRITKEVNVTKDVIAVLDVIKFDIVVYNDGPCNATGVIVEELIDNHLEVISNTTTLGEYRDGTWNIGNLANGSSATLTIVAKVVYSGNIANSVHVSGFENETDYTNNDARIKNMTAIANVDLKVSKEVNVSGVVNVTNLIKFTISVTNNGPCNATGVYVGETLSPHLKMISNETTIGKYDGSTWNIGNLNNGEVHNLTIIAEVISAGTISNAVAIVGNDNDTNKSNNNDSIENLTAVDIVDLQINKTVDVKTGVVNVSDVIVFTVTVKNNGPCDATNVTVNETLSPHLKLLHHDTWDSTYDNGIWYIGNLAKDDWRQLVIVAQVVSAGTISNVVVVTSNENDTNTSNNKDEIDNITALPIVDLQIKKESNFTGSVINVTDYIKYTITVFNAGPCNATNVEVSEVLPDQLKLISNVTENGHYDVGKGIWYIGNLNNQSSAVLTITAQVVRDGIFSNVVVVNSTENDTNPYNNKDKTDGIAAVYIVDLQITKEVNTDKTEIDITESVIFTITVYNAGPCNATGVFVSEPLSDILRLIDNSTATGNWDGYTWYIGDLPSGSEAILNISAKPAYAGIIENAVNVTCNEIDTNLSNNKDNITPIRVSAHIDVGVNKTVNVTSGVVNVGDLVEFVITAYNKGHNNAGGVYALEVLDSHLGEYTYNATYGTTYDGSTWLIGNLDAGAIATLNITARVIKAGNFSNYVQIFAYGNDTNKSNDNYTIPNITAIPVVDLEITKEVNVTSNIVEFGDIIKFTITVTNNGPCDAHDVNVTEVLSPNLKLTNNITENGYYNVADGIWYIGDLNNQSVAVLNITAQVISVGTISNSVNVTSRENDTNKSNNNDTIPDITAIPIVDLQITKQTNHTSNVIYVLDEIKYAITVYNAGPNNATGVNVSEVLSPHLKMIKNETANGYYNVSEGIWYIGDLANKSTAVLTITAKVISDGVISNAVVVNSTENDTDLSNNKDEISNITAVLLFDLQINKTVNVTTVDVGVTDRIQFNITVYNAGPCNATDVYVTETLSDKLASVSNVTTVGKWDGNIWYIGNLTNGSKAVLTIEAIIAYSGIIENVVTVTGNGTDTNISNNKDNITPLNATTHVDLAITKTVNVTTGVVNVSDIVKFTIVAQNKGKFNATGVYVIEELDSHLGDYTYDATSGKYDGHKWNIGYLNAGDSATLEIVAKVIKQGNFSNYVVIGGNDIDENESNNNDTVPNITAVPIVDLEIAKEVNVTSDFIYYNDTIMFTITVKNNGPCDATGVNVTEVLSPHLKMIYKDQTHGYYDVDDGIWYIGNLANGDLARLIIIANVTSVGNITNVVNVTSTENDTNKSNNNASIPNITAKAIVDLKINKTVNVTGTDVTVGDIIKFTLTVVNDGPCNATNVYVGEALDPALRFISLNATKIIKYDNYTWVIGNMTVGEIATLEIVAKIVYSGIIENNVTVLSNDTDINPSNNNDNITPLVATTKVDLGINKTVNVTTGVVNVSDLVKFTITVYNNGPCNASGVYVLEALDSHLGLYSREFTPGTSYDGYTWYIGYLDAGATATLNITARVLEAGNFTNYVEVFGFDNDTNTSNNNYTLPNITARPIVDLDITKEVNVANVTYVGDTVVFTITVRNNGPSDAHDVNVTEVLSPNLEMVDYSTWDSDYNETEGVWHIGTLNRYDWRQLIIITRVVSVGNITNVVTVTSTENDTNKSNNNASIPEIEALPAVDLQIMKDVNVSSGFVEVYDFIEYTITVYNAGPSNATNVKVTEVLSPYLKYIRNETKFGHYNVTEGIWYVGDLAVDARANLTIVALVIRNGTVISNVVTVNSTEKDINPYNNRDEVTIAALPVTDLRITKEVNVTSAEIGVTDLIKFVVTVYNDGPCDATGIYVTESLSDRLKLINNVTTAGEWDGYTWNIPKLANGTNATLTIIAQAVYPGNISNNVVVRGYQNETNDTNNNASIDNITAISNADLEIIKEVNVTSGFVNVSDLIEFTITVRNNGPCDATGVYVGETLNSNLEIVSNKTTVGEYNGFTWTIGNLTNQSTAVLTIVARVISAGNITNVVVVKGVENDTNTSNNEANITNITSLPIVDLGVVKIVNVTSGFVNVTDWIEFTIIVTNYGPCDATGVYVSEVLNPNLRLISNVTDGGSYDGSTWVIGDLANQSSATLTIVAEVVSAGNITNVVSVFSVENDTNASNNEANITNITSLPIVDLGVVKIVNVTSGFVNVTDWIEFTIIVTNYGPCDATGVYVSEVLNPNLRLISNVTDGGSYDGSTWVIGDLANQSSATLVIIAEVVSAGNITNVVSVVSVENDTNASNNEANITNITSLPIVDLEIVKTVNVTGFVNVSDLIEFTITVRNNGPSDATDVRVSEVLNSNLKLISNATSLGRYGGSVWTVGNMANQSSATLTIVAEVISSGNISNVVVVTSRENDTNKSNNEANITNLTALPIVDLSINKTSNITSGHVNVGDLIEFVITVKNNGPSNATGVNVSETLNPNLKLISNVTSIGSYGGSKWTVGDLMSGETATLTIIASVISNGTITNAVDVTSNENDTNKSNNNDSIPEIESLPVVDVSITKFLLNPLEATVGDEITYVITVRNYGPSNATNVIVKEIMSDLVEYVDSSDDEHYNKTTNEWYVGNLDKNGFRSLVLVVKAINVGIVKNSVIVTSLENDTNITNNNESSIDIEVVGDIRFEIVKTSNLTGNAKVGDLVNFTISVTNMGSFNTTNVSIIDELPDGLVYVDCGSSLSGVKTSISGNAVKFYIDSLDSLTKVDVWIVAKITTNGTFVNVASVNSTENKTGSSNKTNVTASPIVDVSVNKTVSAHEAKVGDEVTYTIVVHNNGPSDATDVKVLEKLSNNVALIKATASYGNYDETENIWYVGKLSNNSSETLTLTVKLIESGTVENIVTVTSNETDTNLTNNNYTCDNVTVEKLNTPISLYVYNITYGDDEIIVVTLPGDVTGCVNITVGNRNYSDVSINNGVVELPVTDLGGGNYNVTVIYGGDMKYVGNSTEGIFNVAPVRPIITIEVEDIWVGEVEVLNVTVNAPGSVFVTVFGITVEIPLENGVVTTDVLLARSGDYKGNATWNIINLPVGTYPSFALYPGNENYTSVNTSDVFHVRDKNSTVVVTAEDIHVGEDAIISVKVGPEGVTGHVIINVEGKNYTAELYDGFAMISVPDLKAGLKEVFVWYEGTILYRPSQNSTTFNVLKIEPTIDIDAPEIVVGEDGIITVTVPDDATGTITIEIDGKRYTAPIEDGVAIFIIPGLKVGVHDIVAYYSGDDKYLPTDTFGSINVTPLGENKTDNITKKSSKHGGISLSQYATANPIIVLVMVLLAIGSSQIKRFKRE